MKIKKTDLKVLSKSFTFSYSIHLKLAVGQRLFVTFKAFSNVMIWKDSIHIIQSNYTISSFL